MIALALLLVTGASVDRLVALYAIGVFTAFTMARMKSHEPENRLS